MFSIVSKAQLRGYLDSDEDLIKLARLVRLPEYRVLESVLQRRAASILQQACKEASQDGIHEANQSDRLIRYETLSWVAEIPRAAQEVLDKNVKE